MSYCEGYERVLALLARRPDTVKVSLNVWDHETFEDWLVTEHLKAPCQVVADVGLSTDEVLVLDGAGKQFHFDDDDQCREVAMFWALRDVVVRSYNENHERVESGRGVVVGNIPDCDSWTEAVIVQGSGFIFQNDDMFVAELEAKDEQDVIWTASSIDRGKLRVGADWWCVALGARIATPAKSDPSRYPHKCPKCGSPAYIGFNSTECSKAGCR